mgnify:CR=1 FL=1
MTPIVLVISGHDPSGGAGQIADVQTVSALGAHPALAITALTEQNTQNAYAVFATPADQVRAQLERLAEDMRPAAIKIGLLPSVDVAAAILPTLDALDGVPIVLDPVLIASGGGALAESSLVPFLKAQLLKRCTVITPNLPEAAALTGETNPQAAADALLRLGARWALVTGGDAATEQVSNLLAGASASFTARVARWRLRWPPTSHWGLTFRLLRRPRRRMSIGPWPGRPGPAPVNRFQTGNSDRCRSPRSVAPIR